MQGVRWGDLCTYGGKLCGLLGWACIWIYVGGREGHKVGN